VEQIFLFCNANTFSVRDHSWFLVRYASKFFFFFLLWRWEPTRVMASSLLRFLDHTQQRITVSRNPLDEWSARRRHFYLTTHNTHNRQTSMLPVGFKLTILAGKRPQTYALDRAATGTATSSFVRSQKLISRSERETYIRSFWEQRRGKVEKWRINKFIYKGVLLLVLNVKYDDDNKIKKFRISDACSKRGTDNCMQIAWMSYRKSEFDIHGHR
jgi:hypothetical protein